ncbi:MAG: TolC family protein [Eubacteriales bacterium]|nr:TolC family protein [Eubacteriales bacterium]
MKKFASFILSLVLVVGAAMPAFAQEAVLISAPIPVPAIDAIQFTGPAITVDLETVIEHRLATGAAIEVALINQRSDEAIARGYKEALSNLQLAAPASLTAKITELTRNFARDNLATNHEAELNAIRKEAVDLFYGAFSAQEYYKVAKEDLAVNELMLKNVQRRFDLGAASKLDLMTAQNALTGAKNALAEAHMGYNATIMNFNLEMGYPLMQEVVLKGDLTIPSLSPVDLDAAIASALEQRNEIKGALFAYEIQDVTFANAKLTMNRLSSGYKKQEVVYLTAKRAADTIHDQIRVDVMLKYMGLAQKHLAALSAQSTAALAAEGYRIAQISYNAGMKTLAELQDAEVAANQAKILAIGAVTDMTLALYDFEYATGVGTYRISL